MTIQSAIFGLRFRSNVEIVPTQEELSAFLASAKEDAGKKLHDDDLAGYRRLLDDLQGYRHQRPLNTAHEDFRRTIFFGVLGHTQFFHPSLKSAVELYKYLLHMLTTLDLRKPLAFIASAEDEMSRLNPKKKEQAVRLERLRALVNDRKELLAKRRRRRDAAAVELLNIAGYVRDNLTRIAKLCEASITVLRDVRRSGEAEYRLIEEVKTHFKEQVRDSLQQGQVTKLYLETIQKEVALLSRELSTVLDNDALALIGLYRSIRDHAEQISRELTDSLVALSALKSPASEDAYGIFRQMEQQIIHLVSAYRFELDLPEPRIRSVYPSIVLEKRKEALDHLFALLQRDRRASSDRRGSKDRRVFADPAYRGPERRNGFDRRKRSRRKRL